MAKTPTPATPTEPTFEETPPPVEEHNEAVEDVFVSPPIPEMTPEEQAAQVEANKTLVGHAPIPPNAPHVPANHGPGKSDEPNGEPKSGTGKKKRIDPTQEAHPLVDGVRYNVIAKDFGNGDVRPLYVTDAYTGERLPTNCSLLEKEDDKWYAQLVSRTDEGETTHEGRDLVNVLFAT